MNEPSARGARPVVGRALHKAPATAAVGAAFAAAVRAAVPAAHRAAAAAESLDVAVWLPLAAGRARQLASSRCAVAPGAAHPAARSRGRSRWPAAARRGGRRREAAARGQWSQVCVIAERQQALAATGSSRCQAGVRLCAPGWPLAAGAPPWLAAADEHSARVGSATAPNRHAARRLARAVAEALPAAVAVPAGARRCPRARPAGAPGSRPAVLPQAHADAALADDTLAQLLAIGCCRPSSAPTRSPVRAAAAARSAEHWLARRGERHLRNEPAAGTRPPRWRG